MVTQALAVPFWLWALEQVREEPEGKRCSRRRQTHGGEHVVVAVVAAAVVVAEWERGGEEDKWAVAVGRYRRQHEPQMDLQLLRARGVSEHWPQKLRMQ